MCIKYNDGHITIYVCNIYCVFFFSSVFFLSFARPAETSCIFPIRLQRESSWIPIDFIAFTHKTQKNAIMRTQCNHSFLFLFFFVYYFCLLWTSKTFFMLNWNDNRVGMTIVLLIYVGGTCWKQTIFSMPSINNIYFLNPISYQVPENSVK